MPLKLLLLVGLGIAVELRVDDFTCVVFFFFLYKFTEGHLSGTHSSWGRVYPVILLAVLSAGQLNRV